MSCLICLLFGLTWSNSDCLIPQLEASDSLLLLLINKRLGLTQSDLDLLHVRIDVYCENCVLECEGIRVIESHSNGLFGLEKKRTLCIQCFIHAYIITYSVSLPIHDSMGRKKQKQPPSLVKFSKRNNTSYLQHFLKLQ